ncbi:MAG: hypothetical protein COB20_02605 [SAR86 cluster bacterium]|uniref:Phenazine biosynthesis protein PhzF n=1 Tax=SAR86 cluster bacterium TaxID=2030880 RepID=A0A2A4XDR1_9GAMM|nr:MAG: hypothetical protein COB20_02605 [SAR86 cluster bacterium]
MELLVKYSYCIVDVFTTTTFSGAQLAIFPESEGLNERQMQLIARELNLTETVFMTGSREPNGCKLRNFSPSAEREFSGHAAIAAGYVLAFESYVSFESKYLELSLEQNTGVIELVISRDEQSQFFVQFSRSAEAVVDHYVPDNSQLAEMLSLEASEIGNLRYNTLLVSCEKNYLIVPLKSFEAVRSAVFSLKDWSTSVAPISPANEILLFSSKSDIPQSNFHGRIVGPQIGIEEDPPIASAMPGFAGYLSAHEHVKLGTYSYTIDRGTLATRKSVLAVELVSQRDKENRVRVGGPAVIVAKGKIDAPIDVS